MAPAPKSLRPQVLAPFEQARRRHFLEVGDACNCRFKPPAFVFVMGDGGRRRALAALDRRRCIPDLLVQDERGGR